MLENIEQQNDQNIDQYPKANTGKLNDIIPVEVKSGINLKAKSIKRFNDKFHPSINILLSKNNFSITNKKQICPLYFASQIPISSVN